MPTVGRFRYLESFPRGTSGVPRGRASGLNGTLVLIHGFPLSARMWEPQLDLAERGWRVIAPQLRGFDGPPATPAGESIDDFAGDVIDLLTALHVDEAVIGGLSMGGYITLALFRHAPRYFRGMILADTRAEADSLEGVEARKQMRDLVERQGAAAAAETMMPKLLCEATRTDRPDVVERLKDLILSNSPETITAAIVALMTRPDSTPVLSSIHCPALIVVGDQDSLTPPACSDVLHRGIRGSELAVIRGAGHMSNMEQPAAFNSALEHFLDRRV